MVSRGKALYTYLANVLVVAKYINNQYRACLDNITEKPGKSSSEEQSQLLGSCPQRTKRKVKAN